MRSANSSRVKHHGARVAQDLVASMLTMLRNNNKRNTQIRTKNKRN